MNQQQLLLPSRREWLPLEAELAEHSSPSLSSLKSQLIVSSTYSAVLANPAETTLERRTLGRRASCSGPDSVTPQQWREAFNTGDAATPSGYLKVYANKKASSQGVYG